MNFKAPGNEPVMVALLSGHTCTVTPEGVPLEPRFRKEAIARGCIPVGVGVEDAATPTREPTKAELIEKGIEKLIDGDDPEAFSADGQPVLEKVSAAVGFEVTKTELKTAWKNVQASLKI